jgi:8-oxo-dGTP diphosphatase
MKREVWDAYDQDGNKLGFDLFRGEPIPLDTYHIVVEVYTVTENNEVLITQRHQNKPWALKWEVTGGSILKGETAEQGAIRELREETGIEVKASDLNLVCSCSYKNGNSIYKCYIVFINKEKTKIRLQEGETIDYRYLPYNEFKQFMKTDDFVHLIRQRFFEHEKLFDAIIHKNPLSNQKSIST